MASNTFVLISSVTVGAGGAANITFSSIPSTYTDLLLRLSIRGVDSAINCNPRINFNSDTGSNYVRKGLQGNGSSVGTNQGTDAAIYYVEGTGSTATANTFSSVDLYIPNYAGSTYKSVSTDGTMENNATTSYMDFVAYIWNNTSAINTISIGNGGNNFVQYTTAYLYGIKNS